MSLIGNIAISMTVVTAPLVKGLKRASTELNQFGSSINTAGLAIGASFVAGSFIAFEAIKKLSTAAMGLGEQTDRTRIIFGVFSQSVIDEANKMGDAFGVSKREFIQSAGALGSIFKAAGYSQDDAAKLSVHFVKLATDLSSLTHIPVEEALAKIQSGLAGQVRPLREVGVFMSEEAVKAYAAAHAIGKLGQELTESEKIQARVGFITNALKDAHGNLAATFGSAANQVRSFWGEVDNLSAAVGSALLPILASAFSDITTGLHIMEDAWHSSAIGAASAAVGVVGSSQVQVQSIGFVQLAFMKLADTVQSMGLAWIYLKQVTLGAISGMVEALMPFASALDTILANTRLGILGIGKALGLLTETSIPEIGSSKEALKQYSDELKLTQATLQKEFDKAATAPLASEEIAKQFDAARNKAAQLRADLTNAPQLNVNAIKPFNTGPAATGKVEFAKFAESTSADAVNTILRQKYGGGNSQKSLQSVAQNTAAAVPLLQQIAQSIAGAAVGGPGAIVWNNLP